MPLAGVGRAEARHRTHRVLPISPLPPLPNNGPRPAAEQLVAWRAGGTAGRRRDGVRARAQCSWRCFVGPAQTAVCDAATRQASYVQSSCVC